MKNLYTMRVPAAAIPKAELSSMSSNKFYKQRIVASEEIGEVADVVVAIEVVEPVEVPYIEPEEPKAVSDYLDINDLTVKELKELLDSKDIEYDYRAKKSELIKLV